MAPVTTTLWAPSPYPPCHCYQDATLGTYATQALCEAAECTVPDTWDYNVGSSPCQCYQVLGAGGAFATEQECLLASCTSWNYDVGSSPCQCLEVPGTGGAYETEQLCMNAECTTPSSEEMPIGAIVAFPGPYAFTTTASTSDWLLCDGGTFDATTYPDLYTALGYAPGQTFFPEVPNLCVTLGSTGGVHIEGFDGGDPSQTQTWPTFQATIDQTLVSHTHNIDDHTHNIDGHHHEEFATAGLTGPEGTAMSFSTAMDNTKNFNWGPRDPAPNPHPAGTYGWTQSDEVTNEIGDSIATGTLGTQAISCEGGHMHACAAKYENEASGSTPIPEKSKYSGHRHDYTVYNTGSTGGAQNSSTQSGITTKVEWGDVQIESHLHENMTTENGTQVGGDVTLDGGSGVTLSGGGGSVDITRPKSVQMNWIIRAL